MYNNTRNSINSNSNGVQLKIIFRMIIAMLILIMIIMTNFEEANKCIEFICCCHVYKKSPSHLVYLSTHVACHTPALKLVRFIELFKALKGENNLKTSAWSDTIIHASTKCFLILRSM